MMQIGANQMDTVSLCERGISLSYKDLENSLGKLFHAGNTGSNHEVLDGIRTGAIHPVGVIQYN